VLLPLRAADPWVVALAVSAAVWLAWVAFDYALAPLGTAGAAGAHRAFSDTQADCGRRAQRRIRGVRQATPVERRIRAA
jgi:hypothetical protein